MGYSYRLTLQEKENGYANPQFRYVWRKGKVRWERILVNVEPPIYENVEVRVKHTYQNVGVAGIANLPLMPGKDGDNLATLTNVEECIYAESICAEPIYAEPRVTSLLEESLLSENDDAVPIEAPKTLQPEKKVSLVQRMKNIWGSIKDFFVNFFRFKSEPPINSILISVNHGWTMQMNSPGVIQLDNREHLGNKLAAIFRSKFLCYFKKLNATKEGNIKEGNIKKEGKSIFYGNYVRFDDCDDVINSGGEPNSGVEELNVMQNNGTQECILCSGDKPNNVVKELNVVQNNGTQECTFRY